MCPIAFRQNSGSLAWPTRPDLICFLLGPLASPLALPLLPNTPLVYYKPIKYYHLRLPEEYKFNLLPGLAHLLPSQLLPAHIPIPTLLLTCL